MIVPCESCNTVIVVPRPAGKRRIKEPTVANPATPEAEGWQPPPAVPKKKKKALILTIMCIGLAIALFGISNANAQTESIKQGNQGPHREVTKVLVVDGVELQPLQHIHEIGDLNSENAIVSQ